MNSEEIMDILEELNETSSRIAKEEILLKHSADPMFRKVLQFALSKFITFGISAPFISGMGSKVFSLDSTEDLEVFFYLNVLANRKTTPSLGFLALESLMRNMKPKSAELVRRIVNKDLRCGVQAKTVSKIIPGLIPIFDVMLAHPVDFDRVRWPVCVEPKLDGYRSACLAQKSENKVEFLSRTGHEFKGVDHLKGIVNNGIEEMIKALDLLDSKNHLKIYVNKSLDFMVDGELVDNNFSETGSVKSFEGGNAVFHVFDVLRMEHFKSDDTLGVPYKLRRKLVELFVNSCDSPQIKMVESHIMVNEAEVMALYQKRLEDGYEGLILKDPNSPYRKKRSYDWMKIKEVVSEEFYVVGVKEGTNKNEGKLGALVIDVNGVRVDVGSGFSDGQREIFWTSPPIGRLIEVKFQEYTPDGSLRHPRFVRFRDDKDEKLS